MLTLFALGTLAFWLLVIAESVLLLALIEYEKVGWGTISLIATLAALYFLGNSEVVAYLAQNPLTIALGVCGYFVAGTVWSVAKWWFYVGNVREKYDERKADFLRSNGVEGTVIPDELKKKWKESLAHSTYSVYGGARQDFSNGIVPKARDHKAKILTWMTYWPWSMVWTLINDPVKRLFKYIYRSIQELLQSISNRAFRGVENDMPGEDPPAPPPAPETPAPSTGGDRRRHGARETI
jgi:hypothetical protein